jgi:alpha-D-glucose phosphate-specific phosphoglucomutase
MNYHFLLQKSSLLERQALGSHQAAVIFLLIGRRSTMPTIRFGTDGWRSILAEDFTFPNVRSVTQAIANHVIAAGRKDQGIVVGYDRRFLSDKFGRAAADVLAASGIPVYLTKKDTPTPVTAFAVVQLQAAGAVMITASHNPPEYNGIKFIPYYGGPALPEVTRDIEAHLEKVLANGGVQQADLCRVDGSDPVRIIDPFQDYLEHLRRLIDGAKIKEAGLKVVVDPMYSCGAGYLETLLAGFGCQVEAIHQDYNPLFGGRLPEPNAANLPELIEKVKNGKAHLGLALDGDADRFGIVDGDGSFLTANQVLVLTLYHLLENRRWKGTQVARTVATTHMLNRIGEHYGVKVLETPVGFKYIAKALQDPGTLMGGEESGGMSIRGHLPEKDGILAAALMVELVAVSGRSLSATIREIEQRFGASVSQRLDIHVDICDKETIVEKIAALYPAQVAGLPVVERQTCDGVKIILKDGSWALVRASGTEPLFRLYVEAKDLEQLSQIQAEIRFLVGL